MLVRAEFSDFGKDGRCSFSDDQIELIKEVFPSVYTSGNYVNASETVVEINTLMELAETLGISPSVKPLKGHRILNQSLGNKVIELTKDLKMLKQKFNNNDTVVSVHVPNFSLLSFNEVVAREDYCTDSLQKDLVDGWRIICVCPPMNERRPTYILGRVSPDNYLESTSYERRRCS